ncbi:40S ribosomal protein S11-B [Neolecta irregularis DAH-3]|uniref:40S ribosomal protein S11-B n=1 Tax=Neolecta irregularis (strain DAH-3) TaxID=1198029 RepID=A0A1U7LQ09_NEOID|nr:40S ribosomal protein S11-B [Neolecta irregularis DAH-3]|eukprot:OLL24632.1 40S ribosomal protein S11-B [Neolecta irregularis DAH-3]
MEDQLPLQACKSLAFDKENQSPVPKSPPKRKTRARSLGGAQDDIAIELSRPLRTRESRASLAPGKGILKSTVSYHDDFQSNHTVIGVMAVALKEEEDKETDEEMNRRREKRKSLNRRVSFASHATVRTIPREEIPSTPVQTTPKDNSTKQSPGTPSQQRGTSQDSPLLGKKASRSLPTRQSPRRRSALAFSGPPNDNGEASMDLASDEPFQNAPVIATPSFLVNEIEYPENGEMTMDVTGTYFGFQKDQGLISQRTLMINGIDNRLNDEKGADLPTDFNGISPFGGTTMEFTNAFGQILQASPTRLLTQPNLLASPMFRSTSQDLNGEETPMSSPFIPLVPKSRTNQRFDIDFAQACSTRQGENTTLDMEETRIFGGFRASTGQARNSFQEDDQTSDMDLTRPFTLPKNISPAKGDDETLDMDFTRAFPQRVSEIDQCTIDMDFTRAFSGKPRQDKDFTVDMGTPRTSTPAKEDNLTIDMDLTQPISICRSNVDQSIDMNIMRGFFASPRRVQGHEDVTTDMDITRSIAAPPQRPMKPGQAAVDALLRKPSSGSSQRQSYPTLNSIKLGSPKAVNMLSKRKSIAAVEVFTPTKLSLNEALKKEVFGANIDTPTSSSKHLREMIKVMTPKRTERTPLMEVNLLKRTRDVDDEPSPIQKKRRITLPTLELYQHSCRELKNYITEGTNMCAQIEHDIFEEQPEMFREYIRADLETRSIMDAQFRLIKNYTRAQARGVWYVWREKLLEGLLVGLRDGLKNLVEDESILKDEKDKVNGVMPEIREHHSELKVRLAEAKRRKVAFMEMDKEEMDRIAVRIKVAETEAFTRKEEAMSIQQEVASITEKVKAVETQIQQAQNEIVSAEKVCEENRPVDFSQVILLRGKLEWIERCTGWKVLKASTGILVLKFKDEVKVVFSHGRGKIEWVGKASSEEVAVHYFIDLIQGKCVGSIPHVLLTVARDWSISHEIIRELYLLRLRHPVSYTIMTTSLSPKLRATARLFLSSSRAKVLIHFDISEKLLNEYPDFQSVETNVERVYGDLNLHEAEKSILGRVGGSGCEAYFWTALNSSVSGPPPKSSFDNTAELTIMATELTVQSERAFQKQPHIFQNAKITGAKKTKTARWYKDVGLGFKTPKEAISGDYIDKKCPFTGQISIRGRILTGEVKSTKMHRTIIIRREYLHYITKYNRYEKRHKNLAAHISPCFRAEVGDIVTVGQCRPLSKTVRFNVLRVEKKKGKAAKQFTKF